MPDETFDVPKIASLARLELTEAEILKFERQLGDILAYIEKLKEVDVESIEPSAHAFEIFDIARPDLARPEEGLSPEQALANAPAATQSEFLVPKVLD
ncbi:MAG: Asp-tRNA(Asn)/Glu-tRNA(Gln) amidotransferase subunit GatC [Verrucomicrobiota bacterium]